MLTIAASLWLRGTVKSFIRKTSSAPEKISEGNFSFTVGEDSRDEFGFILNEIESMRINLRAIMADVMLAAKTVDTGSQQVIPEILDLLQRSIEQSERVTGTGATTEEIHQSIAQASELTKKADEMADLTSSTVQIGSEHMDNSIASNEIYTLASSNAEGVRKTKEATEELAHTASELDLLVKHFEKSL